MLSQVAVSNEGQLGADVKVVTVVTASNSYVRAVDHLFLAQFFCFQLPLLIHCSAIVAFIVELVAVVAVVVSIIVSLQEQQHEVL